MQRDAKPTTGAPASPSTMSTLQDLARLLARHAARAHLDQGTSTPAIPPSLAPQLLSTSTVL